ncbi:hypothetical protein [Paraflavitalea speifideaquila]|uniref:hypothetical protein n=1 Tax=Paraflavitalea speifideaquila TaxID=3076558 RepID=UPI0028EAD2F3|nr:hypothetical protein [Paraflavitalea speifideiaquila]
MMPVQEETVQMPGHNPGIPLNNGIYFNDFSDPQDSVWDIGKDETSEYNLKDGKYIMKGLADSLSYSTTVKFNLDIQKRFYHNCQCHPLGRKCRRSFWY